MHWGMETLILLCSAEVFNFLHIRFASCRYKSFSVGLLLLKISNF